MPVNLTVCAPLHRAHSLLYWGRIVKVLVPAAAAAPVQGQAEHVFLPALLLF